MKKIFPYICILAALLAVLCGCSLFVTEIETVTGPSATEYSYVTAAPESTGVSAPAPSTEPPHTVDASTAPHTTEPPTFVVIPVRPPDETAAIRPTETTALAPLQTEPTAAPDITVETGPGGEVDLSVQLPAANGTMEVSTDPQNRFIAAVHEARGLDTALLAAVYTVPESGQNYVFEFASPTARTAESLRRVYLLDTDGAVKSVAAADSAERENVSATENWFCMNVLIKRMVFPAVADRLS